MHRHQSPDCSQIKCGHSDAKQGVCWTKLAVCSWQKSKQYLCPVAERSCTRWLPMAVSKLCCSTVQAD